MRTALDSSVLLAIFTRGAAGRRWLEALIRAREEGELVLCEVVYAEVAPAFPSRGELETALRKLGARFDAIQPESAWLAGETFRAYRRAGGPRTHLIPDFLIAAHAQIQADRLAAIDRGYFRSHFRCLSLLHPAHS